MKQYTHLLFDLDATLLDFHRDSQLAFSKAHLELGLVLNASSYGIYQEKNLACWKALEAGKLDALTLRSLRFEQYLHAISEDVSKGHVLGKVYLERLAEATTCIPGAKDVLQKASRTKTLAIITNGLKEVQRPRIARAGMTELFAEIIVSDEIGLKKPQPEYFEYALRKLGNPSRDQVLVIGDSLSSDIAGAVNAGLDSCWFTGALAKPPSSSSQATYTVQSHQALAELLAL